MLLDKGRSAGSLSFRTKQRNPTSRRGNGDLLSFPQLRSDDHQQSGYRDTDSSSRDSLGRKGHCINGINDTPTRFGFGEIAGNQSSIANETCKTVVNSPASTGPTAFWMDLWPP